MIAGIGIGLALGAVVFGLINLKDHAETLRILERHLEWMRRHCDEHDNDDADWWKRSGRRA